MSVDNKAAIASTIDAAFDAYRLDHPDFPQIPRVGSIQRAPFSRQPPCYLLAQTKYKTVMANGFRRQSVPGGTLYTVVFLIARYDQDLDGAAVEALYDTVKDVALTAFNTLAKRTAGGVIPAVADLIWQHDPQGPYITWLRQYWVGAYMTVSTTEPVQRTNP